MLKNDALKNDAFDPATVARLAVALAREIATQLLQVRPGALAPPAPPEPPPVAGWRWLSPLGERIVRFVQENGPHTGPEICRALGESEHGKAKYLLTDMAERGILESSNDGFRLPVARAAPPSSPDAAA